MNRGEIWTAAGGVYASKPRPVVIIQDDVLGETHSVVVIPLTTRAVEAPLARIPIQANAVTGIDQPSFAMVDKITTVRRSNIGEHLGRVATTDVVEIERAALVVLGIAR